MLGTAVSCAHLSSSHEVFLKLHCAALEQRGAAARTPDTPFKRKLGSGLSGQQVRYDHPSKCRVHSVTLCERVLCSTATAGGTTSCEHEKLVTLHQQASSKPAMEPGKSREMMPVSPARLHWHAKPSLPQHEVSTGYVALITSACQP